MLCSELPRNIGLIILSVFILSWIDAGLYQEASSEANHPGALFIGGFLILFALASASVDQCWLQAPQSRPRVRQVGFLLWLFCVAFYIWMVFLRGGLGDYLQWGEAGSLWRFLSLYVPALLYAIVSVIAANTPKANNSTEKAIVDGKEMTWSEVLLVRYALMMVFDFLNRLTGFSSIRWELFSSGNTKVKGLKA